jgi:Uri superfamily endonuclease
MKGTYLLLLKIKKPVKIKTGGLGFLNFEKSSYAYIGSALNNLEKRIKRHLLKNKKKHWHIDFLTTNKNIKITSVFYKKSNKKQECIFANKLSKFGLPINNFGSSDCKCNSHFFKIKNLDDINEIKLMNYSLH